MPLRFLHIFKPVRHNNRMEFFIISTVLSIFIMPLPFSVKSLFIPKNKKIYFSIYFFRFLKIKSGYLNVKKQDVFLHLTDKTAIVFSLSEMMPKKTSFEIFNLFEFTKIRYSVFIDAFNGIGQFIALSFLNTLNSATFSVLKETKPLIDFRGDGIVVEDKNSVAVAADTGVCFNLFMITKEITENFFKGEKNG